ncbi:hypothetical protein TWF696_008482 [Orbilia brochopaga]|uniref:ATP synthase F0 subunit 8 n=1 Tax=Orbilia brochopaga TaxID=3140254 RepID=A0AAV9UGX6_9PEZI
MSMFDTAGIIALACVVGFGFIVFLVLFYKFGWIRFGLGGGGNKVVNEIPDGATRKMSQSLSAALDHGHVTWCTESLVLELAY